MPGLLVLVNLEGGGLPLEDAGTHFKNHRPLRILIPYRAYLDTLIQFDARD